MRKIVVLNWVTVDGFYAGTNGEIDWIVQDPAVNQATFGIGQGGETMLLTGRVTYQGLESFWPHVANDPNYPEQMRAMANALNQMTKVVFSRTLKEVTWENSVLFSGNLLDEVAKLKQEGDSTLLIFGSGTLIQPLTDAGLIDEYVLTVTPVVLGAGKALFRDVKQVGLELVSTQSFDSGNVLLHYRRA